MEPTSLYRSIGHILVNWEFQFPVPLPEHLAIQRFWKKLEVPDLTVSEARKQRAFESWWHFDQQLTLPAFLSGNWRRARILIHQAMKGYSLGPVVFTPGSEATPTHGYNSLESKLMRSKWDCTPDCWEMWLETAYGNLALKRATRVRFQKHAVQAGIDVKEFHRESWMMSEHLQLGARKRYCFARQLSRVTSLREASRFSTVRKNNEKDRPIDIQPFCNVLCQRRIGEGLRKLLKRNFSIDLDTLAERHRQLVSDSGNATIDLSDASDSVQLSLVEYLFPPWFFAYVKRARTVYVEGLDGRYYVPRKVSSMGNGFTFELMTFILLAIGRQHSDQFSVFGDDIIIPNHLALSLIRDLGEVGFITNMGKTHIGGTYRESCGAHYLDGYGYVRGFDFEYPLDVHDAIVAYNKVFSLADRYPQFEQLRVQLARCVPQVLQGPSGVVIEDDFMHAGMGQDRDLRLSTFFWAVKPRGGIRLRLEQLKPELDALQLTQTLRGFYGYVWRPKLASKSSRVLKMSRHVGKYHAYLHGGRVVEDTITGRGCWQKVAYVQVGRRVFRASSLVRTLKGPKGC